MATPVQRSVTIVDALLNRTATAQERQRLLAAFAGLVEGQATTDAIARAFLATVRHFVLENVRRHESQSATAAVNTDFAETP